MIRDLNPKFKKEIKMKTELKLTHEFLVNHFSLLELVMLETNMHILWTTILENKDDMDLINEFIMRLISDEQLPTLYFDITIEDNSFDHEFGTKRMHEPRYKQNSISLKIVEDYFNSLVLKKELSHVDYDALEDLAIREVNKWDGPYG